MNIDINDLINLTDAKKAGGSWRARCDIHGGKKKTSVQISERNGEVWAFCHVCNANTFDFAKHYGLLKKQDKTKIYPKYPSGHDRKRDYFLIEIFEKGGNEKTIYDKMAYNKAKRRIQIHNEKVQKFFDS